MLDEFLELKRKVEYAKMELVRLREKKKLYLAELESKYGVSSVKEAVKKLDELKAEYDKTEKKIEKYLDQLKKIMEDNNEL